MKVVSINIWTILKNRLIFIAAILLAIFLQTTILVSPSHPFVDNDGDGIDDFEEGIGEYADPEVRARIYGVNFPIADLGNCTSYSECRSFCEDPINYDTCSNYGRDRGLYEDAVDPRDQKVLDIAKGELGCDSYATCKSFCEVPANHDKCNSFARSHNLAGGHVDNPNKGEILGKAKEVLGCDSYISCASFCADDANRSKCSDFAKQTGLSGGERPVGPGGCTSESTCKSFCSDPNNYSVCSGFTQAAGGNFSGPGGCNSPESCRTYCEKNPSDCGYVQGAGASPRPYYNPQEMCNRTPNCAWTSNSCQCGALGTAEDEAKRAGEYAKYCRENPEKCTPGGVGGFETGEDRAAFEKYCTENPDKCRPAYHGSSDSFTPFQEGDTSVGFDPARQCGLYAGCSWVNEACRCGTQYYSYPTPGVSCPEGQYIGPGGYCIPSGGSYTYPTPFTYTYPTPGSTYSYPTPYSYYTTPGTTYTYPTPYSYSYPSPYGYYSYPTPGSTYSYPTPYSYSYPTPYEGIIYYSYPTPGVSYSYPSPLSSGNYIYPTPYPGYTYPTPYSSYSYPTPYSYSYPTPYSYSYPTPGAYSYPTPSSYSYPTPAAYSYPTPQAYSYPTPQSYSYPTPEAYSYPTPQSYSYPTPESYSYPTPSGVQGVTTGPSLWQQLLRWLGF